jgi:23S rRNA (adenine2503-C2)-methyltransferase
MTDAKKHILDLTPGELRDFCAEHGLPSFRAGQILKWIYQRGCTSADDMTDLSKRDRALLDVHFIFRTGEVVADQLATDGTRKLLVQWREAPAGPTVLPVVDPGKRTECVMIPTDDRRTACISSQVGCPVGCTFCASGLDGLGGNLSAGRIVEQVLLLQEHVGERISNVVFMGMGEPLANFKPVVRAVRTLTAAEGLNIGARRITVSTVGLPAAIRRLADELDVQATLALSLHAPTDELRRELIPWAEYATIDELLAACRYYFERTGREITLEYTLMGGLNDRPEQAKELARIARTLRANINLIRYNEVPGLPYKRPLSSDVHRFQKLLQSAGVKAHIRASRGRDIAAACGQLKRETTADIGEGTTA